MLFKKMLFFILLPSICLAQDTPIIDSSNAAQRFAKELNCTAESHDLNRGWCAVVKSPQGQPPSLIDSKSYVGLSMELKTDAPVVSSLLEKTHLSVLHLTKTGVRLTTLTPSSPEESKELTFIISQLAFILKNKSAQNTVSVSAGILNFLKSESQKPGYPAKTTNTGAIFQGKLPSYITRISGLPYGEAYIVIEKASNGQFISIFPMKELQKIP